MKVDTGESCHYGGGGCGHPFEHYGKCSLGIGKIYSEKVIKGLRYDSPMEGIQCFECPTIISPLSDEEYQVELELIVRNLMTSFRRMGYEGRCSWECEAKSDYGK